MDLFLILSVTAALMFATSAILSSHFLDFNDNDYLFLGSIYGWPFFVGFIGLGLLYGDILVSPALILLSATAGIMYSIVLIYYLKGLGSEEASRFIPLLSLNTILLALMSVIFLGDSFSITEYLGMGLAVFGAVLISIEDFNHLKELHSRTGTLIALGMIFLQASRDLLVETVTRDIHVFPTLFWMGIGGIIFTTIILITRKKDKFDLSNLVDNRSMMAVGGIHATGYILFASAISLGAAAKASAIIRLNPLFVFLGATFIAFVFPEFINEETDWIKIVQKLIASVMIIVGVLLVS